MKKTRIMVLGFLLLTSSLSRLTSGSSTNVGGIISKNITWTAENSPYVVTDTVQIPEGVTLTIEPNVTVLSQIDQAPRDMFLLNGRIEAHGTVDGKIIFDGGGNSNIFNPKKSTAASFLNLSYCIIKSGRSLWPPTGYEQYGSFSIKHCELANLTYYSHIWYPKRDVYIEYNTFVNCAGFSVGHDGPSVYIEHNLVKDNRGFFVQNWASYAGQTIVKYNSFIDTQGTLLELKPGYDAAAMTATENYWGTNDTNLIDSMIYDKKDDITCADYIQYLPILAEPDPDTPTLPVAELSIAAIPLLILTTAIDLYASTLSTQGKAARRTASERGR